MKDPVHNNDGSALEESTERCVATDKSCTMYQIWRGLRTYSERLVVLKTGASAAPRMDVLSA